MIEEHRSLSILNDCEIKPHSKIIFDTGSGWFLKMSEEGIKFNREKFPHSKPEDFASAFMELLEKSYDIKFVKKGM